MPASLTRRATLKLSKTLEPEGNFTYNSASFPEGR